MKNIKYLGGLMLLALLSCDKPKTVIDITENIVEQDGFIDLTLTIASKTETDSTYIYLVEGVYNSEPVGLEVALKKGITAGIVNGEMVNIFVTNGIGFKSIGVESDNLLNAMAKLYGIESQSFKMKTNQLFFTCANLNDKNVNYNSGDYHFKIFMDDSNDEVSELFVNFDFTKNFIFLNEKDQDYRQGIIDFLKQ